jgi:hypothetical protein
VRDAPGGREGPDPEKRREAMRLEGGSAVGALCLSQRARGRPARPQGSGSKPDGRNSKLDGRKSKPVGRKSKPAGRKSKSGGRKSKSHFVPRILFFQWVIAEFGRRLGRCARFVFALLSRKARQHQPVKMTRLPALFARQVSFQDAHEIHRSRYSEFQQQFAIDTIRDTIRNAPICSGERRAISG